MKECIRGVLQKARECIVVAKEGSYKRRVYWEYGQHRAIPSTSTVLGHKSEQIPRSNSSSDSTVNCRYSKNILAVSSHEPAYSPIESVQSCLNEVH